MHAANDPCVALSTAPDMDSAKSLATALVERRLVACVQVVPGATSIYRWQGVVEEAAETLLVMKTRGACIADIEQLLRQRHPYDVPELVVLAASHVEARYLAWLTEQSDGASQG